jgi:hypothetical protein
MAGDRSCRRRRRAAWSSGRSWLRGGDEKWFVEKEEAEQGDPQREASAGQVAKKISQDCNDRKSAGHDRGVNDERTGTTSERRIPHERRVVDGRCDL